ncbi:MAG: fructose-1,6-bisphosphatase/inositol monophosphatase family enzyme [Myxococcota bacterium]|jgi:fructose-1,6-bisphosphatase/inositol monophosphatase family enzyme
MSNRRAARASLDQFVELMTPAVVRAGTLARSLEGRVSNSPKRDEVSDVKQALTLADTGTQEIILKALLEHYPEVCLAAEEDTETVDAFPKDADAQVVIDPIDGTLRSYLEGTGPYAVIVGVAVREVFQASLVSLPREGIVLDATRGRGAYKTVGGRSRRSVRAETDGNRILVSHGMPSAVSDVLRAKGYEVVPSCGGAVSVAPLIKGVCAGVRFADTPVGVSIRGRVGVLIAREGGALVRAAAGADFPDDLTTRRPTVLLASEPQQLDDLDDALREGLGEGLG